MFGDNVFFDDTISELLWADLPEDIKDWLYKHGTKPVHTPHLFPREVGMLATYGDFPEEREAKYKKYGIEEPPPNVMGSERYYPDWLTKELVEEQGLSEHEFRTLLHLTDYGEWASSTTRPSSNLQIGAPKIEEYLHYLDDVMGDTSTSENPVYTGNLSDIMASHMNQSWAEAGQDKDELLEAWMNDPNTSHLEIEDAPDWSHHGNKINPRLEMGKFLVESMTDKNYRNWAQQQPEEMRGYWHTPTEVYANIARPLIQYTDIDKFRKEEEGGGFSGVQTKGTDEVPSRFITDIEMQGLDRGLAHAISTYVNAQAREEQEPSTRAVTSNISQMPPKGHLNFPLTPTMQPLPISEPTRQPIVYDDSPPIQKSRATPTRATPVRYLQQFQQLKKAGAPVRRTGSKYGFGL